MSKRNKDAPTWIYNERHGWLVDESPLFEAIADGETNLDWCGVLLEVHEVDANGLSQIMLERIDTRSFSWWGARGLRPLTNAAKTLHAAALKAEQESH